MVRIEDLLEHVSRVERLTGKKPAQIVVSAAEFYTILLDARLPADAWHCRTFMGIPLKIEG